MHVSLSRPQQNEHLGEDLDAVSQNFFVFNDHLCSVSHRAPQLGAVFSDFLASGCVARACVALRDSCVVLRDSIFSRLGKLPEGAADMTEAWPHMAALPHPLRRETDRRGVHNGNY